MIFSASAHGDKLMLMKRIKIASRINFKLLFCITSRQPATVQAGGLMKTKKLKKTTGLEKGTCGSRQVHFVVMQSLL